MTEPPRSRARLLPRRPAPQSASLARCTASLAGIRAGGDDPCSLPRRHRHAVFTQWVLYTGCEPEARVHLPLRGQLRLGRRAATRRTAAPPFLIPVELQQPNGRCEHQPFHDIGAQRQSRHIADFVVKLTPARPNNGSDMRVRPTPFVQLNSASKKGCIHDSSHAAHSSP